MKRHASGEGPDSYVFNIRAWIKTRHEETSRKEIKHKIMEKFNLKRAENGEAVCLGDGTPVKILDFDYQGKILYKYNSQRRDGKVEEKLGWVTKEGEGLHEYGDDINLYMAPTYAYATIYEQETTHELYSGKLCQTPEEAEMQKDNLFPEMRKFCTARVELFKNKD